jgi:hypothetical protein
MKQNYSVLNVYGYLMLIIISLSLSKIKASNIFFFECFLMEYIRDEVWISLVIKILL